jgi:nucleoside 2-deoxyribosyltransferase
MKEKRIYLAGPLFSEAERAWARDIKRKIEEAAKNKNAEVKVIWPYELTPEKRIKKLKNKAKLEIFKKCASHLKDSDILVAVLDGTQVDDGTAWEIGYFYKNKKPKSKIYGIRTDFRKAGETRYSKVNSMIEVSCDEIVDTPRKLIERIKKLLY